MKTAKDFTFTELLIQDFPPPLPAKSPLDFVYVAVVVHTSNGDFSTTFGLN